MVVLLKSSNTSLSKELMAKIITVSRPQTGAKFSKYEAHIISTYLDTVLENENGSPAK